MARKGNKFLRRKNRKRPQRQEQAAARKVASDKLTIEEKIHRARSRRGESKKELTRLMSLLEKKVG